MKPGIISLYLLSTIALCNVSLSPSAAQISSDGTLSTTVTSDDGINFLIENGDRAGGNLFHSFREFSIPNLGEAYFNNPTDIANIFSRVTGGNISDIQGLIRANGTANLFLINPAGIIFGENASLDIGGSFFASTAESIVFGEGIEFSAIEPQAAPLLTVNITPGLQYGANPLPIDVSGANLAVNSGQSISLLGGDVTISNSQISAPGGQINLGGLAATGTIQIEELTTIFPENTALSNVNLTDTTILDVTSTNNGNIAINAADFNMSGASEILAGLTSGGSNSNAISGNIIINATGNTNLSEQSLIANDLQIDALGNSGNIEINTNSLSITEGSRIQTVTNSSGASGDITIYANTGIVVDGFTNDGLFSGVLSRSATETAGAGGNITVNSPENTLTLSNRGFIGAVTNSNSDGGNIETNVNNLVIESGGQIVTATTNLGNAGNITINATESVNISGESRDFVPNPFLDLETFDLNALEFITGFDPNVAESETIPYVSVERTSTQIISGTTILGAAADQVDYYSFSVTQGGSRAILDIDFGDTEEAGSIDTTIFLFNQGTGELIEVNDDSQTTDGAEGSIERVDSFIDTTLDQPGFYVLGVSVFPSEAINNQLVEGFRPQIGDTYILQTSLENQGTEGLSFPVNLLNPDNFNLNLGALSGVSSETSGIGNGGKLTINTGQLILNNQGRISSETLDTGKSGDIIINATGNINLSDRSLITNDVQTNAVDSGGKIEVTTNFLTLTGGSRIQTETDSMGSSGHINIQANSDINITGYADDTFFSGILTIPAREGTGDGGDINIATNNLNLTQGGRISIETRGAGNAGNLNIQAAGDVEITSANSDRLVSRLDGEVNENATGDGGSISIETTNLHIIDGGRISVETEGESNAGNVTIKATEDVEIRGVFNGFASRIDADLEDTAMGNGGDISIEATNLHIIDGGRISFETEGEGNAGNLTIKVTEDVEIRGIVDRFTSRLDGEVEDDATGNGGNISIEAANLRIIDGGRIFFETDGAGNAGNLTINVTEDIEIRGVVDGFISRLDGDVETDATGNGGSISIETNNLYITDGGRISLETDGVGNAGNLEIKATGDVDIIGIDLDSEHFSRIDADVDDTARGKGGSVVIETNNLRIMDGGRITMETEGEGNAGNLEIKATGDVDIIGVHPLGFVSLIDADVDSTATGNGGSVVIETNNLRLIDGGRISVQTNGVGNAGNLEITTSESVAIVGNSFQPDPSGLEAEVGTSGVGNGGDILLQTNSLLLSEGGRISANTDGMGRGGSVTINATDLELIGVSNDERSLSRIEAASTTDASAGSLNITTDNLTIRDRAQITVSGLSLGDAGNLNLSANNISLDNQASLRAQVTDGNQGNIHLQIQDSLIAENNSQIIADVNGSGSGGNIHLTTDNLQFNSGSTVITDTTSTGNAGNINILGDNLTFDGELTGVFSEAVETSTGDAGGINLTANLLSVTNNAQVSTNSEGLGTAGNINIDANRLEANQGNITATSLQTGGGNLFLNIDDLLLSNQSLISTSVLDSTGGGGNITINSDFIFARENSNIFANAVFGAGGNIQINTDTIFIAPDSAITASSEFGVDGVVNISNPDTDNNVGLLELPKETTDPSQQIAEGCGWVRNNSFIVTGRGGIKPNPTNNLDNDQMWSDIRYLSPQSSVTSHQSLVNQSAIIEANAWIVNEQGNVELVAVLKTESTLPVTSNCASQADF